MYYSLLVSYYYKLQAWLPLANIRWVGLSYSGHVLLLLELSLEGGHFLLHGSQLQSTQRRQEVRAAVSVEAKLSFTDI